MSKNIITRVYILPRWSKLSSSFSKFINLANAKSKINCKKAYKGLLFTLVIVKVDLW